MPFSYKIPSKIPFLYPKNGSFCLPKAKSCILKDWLTTPPRRLVRGLSEAYSPRHRSYHSTLNINTACQMPK